MNVILSKHFATDINYYIKKKKYMKLRDDNRIPNNNQIMMMIKDILK